MFGLGRASRILRRPLSEGTGPVACASAMPIIVLVLWVAVDFANVSHFRNGVQNAADAASLAAAESIAQQPDLVSGAGGFGAQVAGSVFTVHAPRGAGAPTVSVENKASAVTANVGYAGLAPSAFGSALGYDAVSVDASSTSLARVADLRQAVAR